MKTKPLKTKWAKRIAASVGITAGLLTAGAAYQSHETRAEARRHAPPGKLVNVGGHELHLYATGKGGPTVVLEGGASCFYGVWNWIQPEIAKRTRVVSYDRAGLGFSEAVEGPRDAARVARELHVALTRSGETGPFVLVGWSYGALFVTEYAELFPERVAGLVLVDGTHPDQVRRSPEMRKSMDLFRGLFHLASRAADFGVLRFTNVFTSMADGLAPEQMDVAKALYASPGHLEASARELDAWNESSDQVRDAKLGDYPKLFLSASGPDAPHVRQFKALHQELADRHPGTEHRTLPGTTHITMVTHREQAQMVTKAILDVVERARERSTDTPDSR